MSRFVRVAGFAMVLLVATVVRGSAAGGTLEVNAILSLTGQAAFIGTTYQKTLLAMEALYDKNGGFKGQQIHFNFQDDQSNPQVSVQLANILIARKVPAFLGPNVTATCRAVLPLLNDGPTSYCLSPGVHPPKGSYMFSAGVDTRDQAAVILRYLQERGWHNAAMIVTTDATGQDADAAFDEDLKLPESRGVQLVAHEHFNVTDPSVNAQLVKIKASNPQVIVVWSTGTPLGTVLRGIQETGIDVPIIMTNANAISTQMKSYANVLPPQLISYGPPYMLASANVPRAAEPDRDYFGALRAAGVESDYITGLVWDPALLVLSAFVQGGPNANATQIRDYILGQKAFRGIAGSFDFTDGSQRGQGRNNMMMMRWDPAKSQWDASSRLGGALR